MSIVLITHAAYLLPSTPVRTAARPVRGAIVCQADDGDALSFRTRLREANVDRALLAELSSLYSVWHARGRSGGRPRRHDDDYRWGARPKFVASAATPSSLPPETLPEVAFIGRSNVGKSSLLNALMGMPGAARVSDKPGKTQQLAFFQVGAKREEFFLVDMPGYGFALAGEKDVARWQALCQHYLQKRKVLQLVVVLVDGRTGLKRSDLQMLEFLEGCGCKYAVVHTKVAPAGRKCPPPCLTTPPHRPAWCLLGLRPRLRTPERRASTSEDCRGLRSPPQAAPKLRMLHFQPAGGRGGHSGADRAGDGARRVQAPPAAPGEIQGRYRGDTGEIQGRYRGDTREGASGTGARGQGGDTGRQWPSGNVAGGGAPSSSSPCSHPTQPAAGPPRISPVSPPHLPR